MWRIWAIGQTLEEREVMIFSSYDFLLSDINKIMIDQLIILARLVRMDFYMVSKC